MNDESATPQTNGYMEQLIAFGDEIVRRLELEPQERDNYFMTLVYIEDILDKYGRGSAWIGADQSHRMMVNKKMNDIRGVIRKYSQDYNFDEVLRAKGEQIYRGWHRQQE